MVSQLNNTGLRFYLNQNESLGAPYSYFLDYPYSLSTGLNHANNQQNQLGPPIVQAPEEKKAKKPKKKAGVEKNSKDNLSSEDLSKESLIGWLKSLSVDQRFEVFSVKDKWLATAFIQMYKNWKDCHDIGFQVLPEENNKQSEKNDSKFGELKDHFYCRKYISVSFSDKKAILDKAQEEIIESVRLYDDHDYYDTIVLKEDLIQDIDHLLELFDLISEEKAFTKPIADTNQKGLNVETSTWFNSTSLQTLGAWIVSSFEKQIWTEYLENKKGQASFQGTLDFKMIVNYRSNLIDFWKGLEKTKKKKIAFEANETGKYLVATNPRLNLNNQEKEINEGLKELYESKLFAEARGPNPQETFAHYFNSLVENENESLVIDTFLFTSLTHFGTTTNLICRKLAHKLRLLLCEKIASDLILNEEKEKRNNNKKKNKKKKTKKTNTQQNDILNDEEIIVSEQENNFQMQDQVQQENLKSIINEEESKLTDRSDSERPRYEDYIPLRSSSQDSRENEAYSEQIANLKRQQQAAKEADSRKTTTSAKNNFADASTSNGSETEEKFDPENNKILSTKKAKIEEKQAKIEKEEKIQENQGVVDDWALFEESENKVSKSSKKRQKRKLKKKAIQESMKAQEEQSKSECDAEADADTTPKTDTTSKENKFHPSPELKTDSSISNPKQADSKVSSRKSSEASENAKSEKDKKEKAEDLTKSSAFAITPQEFDDFGFIEVKAKKKTEKEKKSKSKKDGKESWRRNKEKEAVEKKKPQKEAPKTKPVIESTTTNTKKSTAVLVSSNPNPIKLEKAASTPPVQKVVTTIEKTAEGGEHSNSKPKSKEATKVSLIIPAASKQKVLTPPSLKTAASNPPASGSSSASESETTSCTSKEVSQTSTSSIINPSENHNSNHSSHSVPKNLKGPKTYHPLSLTSPSLDPETIRIAKVKEYANEFFNKKFKNDLYQHVSGLTEGSNKIMNYRILAYHRLTYCISKLFPNSPVKTKIFGSCATGLALTSSDVDISVSGIEAYDKFQICEHLSTISQCLKQFKWVVENKPILTASVPILKIEIEIQKNFADIIEGTDPKGLYKVPLDPQETLDIEGDVDLGDLRIRVDLSLESMGMSAYSVHIGYKTTDFVQKMLQKYESLYIVTMILKEFLNSRKFLNNFQGGISSYCLVIMIIAIFQKFGDEGYMESLKRFLSFYGGTFKPEILGITLLEADPFFPLNHSYETAPFWVIEHSTFQGKNIGGGCYMIKFILHEFEKASKTIEYFRQKVEKTVLQHQEALNCADDIEKVDGDQEFKSILNSNILNLIINDV